MMRSTLLLLTLALGLGCSSGNGPAYTRDEPCDQLAQATCDWLQICGYIAEEYPGVGDPYAACYNDIVYGCCLERFEIGSRCEDPSPITRQETEVCRSRIREASCSLDTQIPAECYLGWWDGED